MNVSFKEYAVKELKTAQKQFGTYAYNDKGPNEVMAVHQIIAELKKVSKDLVIPQLLDLCSDTSTDLDPSRLVCTILIDMQEEAEYEFLFEHQPLLDAADF